MSKPWDKLRVPEQPRRSDPIAPGKWEFNGCGAVLIGPVSRTCADIAVGEACHLDARTTWTVHKSHALLLAEFFSELADQLESQ